MQHLYEKVGPDRVGDTASDVLLRPGQPSPSTLPPVGVLSAQEKPWAVYMVPEDGWGLAQDLAQGRCSLCFGLDYPPAVLKVKYGCSISIPLPSGQYQGRLMTHDVGIAGSVCRPHHTKLQSIGGGGSSSPFSDNHGDL